MTPIKAVLFDYGMVLSGPPDPAAQQQMEALLGADSASFDAAYWKYRDDYDRGILSGHSYWAAVADDLHKPLDAETLAGLMYADTMLWTQPNPRMIEWAAQLHRAGFRTGILSNIGDAMEAGIYARFDWIAGFDHHTFSHRLGIAKPDPAIYQHAIAGMEVPAREILFVDDREVNIAAAQAAGLIAIPYTSHEAFLQALDAAGIEGLPVPAR